MVKRPTPVTYSAMLHRSWFDWTLAMDAVADTRCWDSAELWLGQQARAAARAAAPEVPAIEEKKNNDGGKGNCARYVRCAFGKVHQAPPGIGS